MPSRVSNSGCLPASRRSFISATPHTLSYAAPWKLRRTLLSYVCTMLSCAAPFWAPPHPTDLSHTLYWAAPHTSELRRTILSYAAPFWATLHPIELRRTLNWLNCSLVLPLLNNYLMNTRFNNNDRLQFTTFTFVSNCRFKFYVCLIALRAYHFLKHRKVEISEASDGLILLCQIFQVFASPSFTWGCQPSSLVPPLPPPTSEVGIIFKKMKRRPHLQDSC